MSGDPLDRVIAAVESAILFAGKAILYIAVFLVLLWLYAAFGSAGVGP